MDIIYLIEIQINDEHVLIVDILFNCTPKYVCVRNYTSKCRFHVANDRYKSRILNAAIFFLRDFM